MSGVVDLRLASSKTYTWDEMSCWELMYVIALNSVISRVKQLIRSKGWLAARAIIPGDAVDVMLNPN